MMSKLYNRIANNIVVKNVVMALFILILLFVITFLSIRIYTDHGDAYPVPDLRGLSKDEADKLLISNDMRMQVSDSVYISELPKGVVVDQNPKPQFMVKKNRTVFLTMNANNPEMVTIPEITGRSFRQAKAILESYGLKVGKIQYKPDIAKNYVLEQRVNGRVAEAGDSIIKGKSIDLVLGNGLSDISTPVPDLIMLKPEEAKNRLTNAYLNLGAAVYDNSILTEEDSLKAFVFKQRPNPTRQNSVRQGSFVDIWLTVDSTKIEIAETD